MEGENIFSETSNMFSEKTKKKLNNFIKEIHVIDQMDMEDDDRYICLIHAVDNISNEIDSVLLRTMK